MFTCAHQKNIPLLISLNRYSCLHVLKNIYPLTYIHLLLPQEGRGSADPQAEESHEPCAHFQADGKWREDHHGWL